jgi:putative sigma-54 modulation protein
LAAVGETVSTDAAADAIRASPGETSAVQVQISTRHGHLSDASQQNITAKAEKLLRIFDRITAIEVTVDLKDSDSPRVDAKVSSEHKHDFVAHDQSANLMGSVDTVFHRLEQQLRKYKEKVQERHRGADTRRQGAAPHPDSGGD